MKCKYIRHVWNLFGIQNSSRWTCEIRSYRAPAVFTLQIKLSDVKASHFFPPYSSGGWRESEFRIKAIKYLLTIKYRSYEARKQNELIECRHRFGDVFCDKPKRSSKPRREKQKNNGWVNGEWKLTSYVRSFFLSLGWLRQEIFNEMFFFNKDRMTLDILVNI